MGHYCCWFTAGCSARSFPEIVFVVVIHIYHKRSKNVDKRPNRCQKMLRWSEDHRKAVYNGLSSVYNGLSWSWLLRRMSFGHNAAFYQLFTRVLASIWPWLELWPWPSPATLTLTFIYNLDLELWPWLWCMTLTFSLVTLTFICDLGHQYCDLDI